MGALGFGRGNPFPFTLGGGESVVDSIHVALLDAYAPGWDVEDDTEKNADAYAEALAVTFVWVANRRIANQAQPLKMLETLPVWEEAARLRPRPNDRDSDRRRRLASKLRGIANSTLTDIADACDALLGNNFVAALVAEAADQITYWPGQNPGPPGYEWSSNRAHVQIQVSKAGVTDSDFLTMTNELERVLDGMCPAWMTFSWHTGSGFVIEDSLLGEMAL